MKPKFLGSKFFTFIKPWLAIIDSPTLYMSLFDIIHYLFATVFMLTPIGLLVLMIKFGIFEMDGKTAVAAVLVFIALLVAGWIAMQDWICRIKSKKVEIMNIEVVTTEISDIVYTFFESAAHFIGIGGFIGGLFALLFGADEILQSFGLPDVSVAVMIVSLLYGYFGIFLAKFMAFLFRKLFHLVILVIGCLWSLFFIFCESIARFMLNSWKVLIELVAKLGRFLHSYAQVGGVYAAKEQKKEQPLIEEAKSEVMLNAPAETIVAEVQQ